jgi:hypothetical protein
MLEDHMIHKIMYGCPPVIELVKLPGGVIVLVMWVRGDFFIRELWRRRGNPPRTVKGTIRFRSVFPLRTAKWNRAFDPLLIDVSEGVYWYTSGGHHALPDLGGDKAIRGILEFGVTGIPVNESRVTNVLELLDQTGFHGPESGGRRAHWLNETQVGIADGPAGPLVIKDNRPGTLVAFRAGPRVW